MFVVCFPSKVGWVERLTVFDDTMGARFLVAPNNETTRPATSVGPLFVVCCLHFLMLDRYGMFVFAMSTNG